MGFTAVAQTGKVSGVVKDANGEPLIGATVMVKGTTNGVSTDVDGKFTIGNAAGKTLVVSYVGFKTKEVKAANASNIVLESASQSLDEVVVTAEFGMKRVARAVGSSVQNVKASDVIESGRTDFLTALQGKVSGMQVTSTSGAPGASNNVVLRSVTSLTGSNQPLYVVDGVPMNNSTFNAGNSFAVADAVTVNEMDFSSRGSDFNPEDIESMTVLKGAAAAALYGSDASNGAIIITTKKGSKGRAKITYSNQFSWSKAYGWPEKQDKYMNGNYGATNWYYTANYGGENLGRWKIYDNLQAVLQTGFMQRHNINLEAGDEKKSFRASYSLTDQEGVVKTTDYKRNNVSIAGQAQLNKWAKVDGSMQYSHMSNSKVGMGTNGPVYRAYTWPIVDDMSNYMAPDGLHMAYPTWYNDTDMLNPLFGMYKNKNYDESDHITASLGVSLNPFEGFMLNGRFGWDYSASTYESGTHPFYRSNNQNYPTAVDKGGSYNIAKQNLNDKSLDIIARYDKEFNKLFNVGLQVGYHQLERGTTRLASSGSEFMTANFMSINNCEGSTISSKKADTKRRLQAISARAEVGYNNMAFLTLSMRNDWSSTLPKANNSYFYPAVEGSFVVSEIAPIREATASWLDYVKLRASWAQVGKDAQPLAIDPELEAQDLTNGGYAYGYTGPNKALVPEMNTSTEVGIEFRAIDNRLDGDFTYYWTKCDDQIVTGFRMSYATGFVLNNMNVGSFKTWGWEGRLGFDVIKTRDFTWNLGVTGSHTGSEVTYLPENLTEYYDAYTWLSGNMRNGTKVGYPITTITGYAFERNNAGDILIHPLKGLPIVDVNEWRVMGDREPEMRYGITTRFNYKDFSLSAAFSGMLDATIVNITEYDMMNRGQSWESVEQREGKMKVFTGVLKDGKENTANPTWSTIVYNPAMTATTYTGSDGSYTSREPWVDKNVHYIRCQEIRLNYTVPSEFLNKVTKGLISRANVYVSGNDLFTITNYAGINPVGNSSSAAAGGTGGLGFDNWGLPSPRTYTCGLSVTF
ncbi:MAG: SusC/RagA family TonB-linked outer membrane protein [Bacteroidales bacterium]|nr:SusC/RagA family TonB-linked outer membrane protein [Bacteroidales bacterium]